MGLGLGLRSKYRRLRDEIRYARANLSNGARLRRLGVVFWEPSDACWTDRILLYALVRGLRPERVLEIGVQWGGGAKIIATALEDAGGPGRAVGLEPRPELFRVSPGELYGRYEIHAGYAPRDIPGAVAKLGGPLDLAYVDSMNTHDHTVADVEGLLPHMARGGHIIVHNGLHQGRVRAFEELVAGHPELVDCGILSRHVHITEAPVIYQGLRLLRVGTPSNEELIRQAYRREGRPEPEFSPEYWNWDFLWNRLKDREDANEFAGRVPGGANGPE